jgi:hypothetical protein
MSEASGGASTRKIAILGKAPSSLKEAPVTDTSWELWVLNDMAFIADVPRWNVLFELHSIDNCKELHGGKYWEWLQQPHGPPVFMQRKYAEVPDSREYPLEVVRGHFGDYFTNSVSYMIALAILQRPAAIGLWGVDMAQRPEYREQRPSCEWLIGWAQGAGIAVTVPDTSSLMKSGRLYGYDQTEAFWKKYGEHTAELEKKQAAARHNAEVALQQEAYFRGALDCQAYYGQWMP